MKLSERNKLVLIALAVLSGGLAIGITSGLYIAEFGGSLSADDQSWSNFGSYFGGVAGALLSFIAMILIATAIFIQLADLTESRRSNDQQSDFMQKQLSLMRNEQKAARLADVADAAIARVEHALASKVDYKRDQPMKEFIGQVFGIALLNHLVATPLTLAQAVEEALKDEPGEVAVTKRDPDNISISPFAKELAFSRLPLLAASLESLRKSQKQRAEMDDLLDDQMSKDYHYDQIAWFRELAMQLHLLGAYSGNTLENWRVSPNPITRKGIIVLLHDEKNNSADHSRA